MRTSKPITVTLGELQERVDARVRSGTYTSASDVLRAGLRALDREEAAIDAVLRQKVQEALGDPRAPIPADEVFAKLRAHQKAFEAKKDDAPLGATARRSAETSMG